MRRSSSPWPNARRTSCTHAGSWPATSRARRWKKLFDTLGARYATRSGGYTRILRLGPRKGDGAEMAIVELLGSEFQPKKAEEKGKKEAVKAEGKKEQAPKAKGGKKAKAGEATAE